MTLLLAGLCIAGRALPWMILGAALGGGFFWLLRLNVRYYASGRAWPAGVTVHLARWAILLTALTVIARVGAVPLLATAGGVLCARLITMRGIGRALRGDGP